MLEFLIDIDAQTLLAVNGLHDAFQDALWWLVTAKWSSLLLLLALFWVLLRQNRRHALLMLAMIALTVLIADQMSSGLIKQLVQRLRPTHDPALESAIHVINGYRGGMYGFVSSHASNFVASSTIMALVMRHRAVTLSLTVWTLMQCYSRVYLGVHYPGDILGGIVVGVSVAGLIGMLMLWIERKWHIPKGYYTRTDAMTMASSFAVTVIALVTASLIQVL
jgi:undecaprenyl-diphosphatase